MIAYMINNFEPNFIISDYLTLLYSKNAYFSYSLDLSSSADLAHTRFWNIKELTSNFIFVNNLQCLK